MKKIINIIIVMLCVNILLFDYKDMVKANKIEDIYTIYDTSGHVLFQQEGVEIGDMYMGKDYIKYIVKSLNNETYTGIAEVYEKIKKPNVTINEELYGTNIEKEKRTICLYMTHNDESYLPSDGYDSIYGNGGILDVSKAFESNLESLGIDVVLDDTLHIPHDTVAYDRSNKTANRLKDNYNPDTIFDMHRDATSRKTYLANVDGKDMGKVRIVLGLSNPYLEENEEFALYLLSVAEEMYPWLFLDIYYGKGHYNQSVSSKSLLFEMGCHLIEKEYEILSTKPLAEVISTALYKTTVNEDSGDLTINGVESNNDTNVNEVLEKYDEIREDNIVEPIRLNIGYIIYIICIVMLLSGVSIISMICLYKDFKEITKKR